MMDCVNLRLNTKGNGLPGDGQDGSLATYIRATIDEALRHVLEDVRTVIDSEVADLRAEMRSHVNLAFTKSEQASVGLSHAMEEMEQLRGHLSPVSRNLVQHDAMKESREDVERRLSDLELQLAKHKASAFRVPEDPPVIQSATPPVIQSAPSTTVPRALSPGSSPVSVSGSPALHDQLDSIARKVEVLVSELGSRARVTDLDQLKQEFQLVKHALNLHASADQRVLDMVVLMEGRLVTLEVLTNVRDASSPSPANVAMPALAHESEVA
eukprot:TRINITY_DN92877_c0_g1_i1.p1 TRINITY_DN92877_c0_g1~~TRINITY_DN92877_c0_g1_i1.p1  ORF type:complete len:269 (+),score=42.91 TRINITY_DN92877_c0_g1_i1:76-882(+)